MAYAEVIGDPIAHSKSPAIHGFWLAALGIDAEYRATHVVPDDLERFLADRTADPEWRGCNVTVPHKVAALDHVADPGDVRGSIGAVNTIFRQPDGSLAGTNTDAAGFWAPIADLDLSGEAVTVIGAGGAARAILWALGQVGVGPVMVMNRNPLKAAALLSRFGLKGQALPLGPAAPPSRLLVNASSLGMTGQPPLALDLSALPDHAVVYDIVYAPLETDLLAAARARDLATVDGLDMLIAQAAAAFAIVFGKDPPRDRDEDWRALLTATHTIGLTGSIGMGKSTVAAMFADAGVPVFDADAAVHRLQGPGGACVPAIEATFPGTTGPAGVDRAALAAAVLGDDAAMKRLEAIVHPAVAVDRAAFLAAHATASLVVFDIPLLFETAGESRVDTVVVVSADAAVQRARVLARPGMTAAKLDAILARQLPDAAKRARADVVIATDVPLAETRSAVRRVIACAGRRTGG